MKSRDGVLLKILKGLPQIQCLDKRHTPKLKIAALVSGGVDSIFLLDVLIEWRNFLLKKESRFPEIQVYALHFNHKKRGIESDRDADFVVDLCLKKGIPIAVHEPMRPWEEGGNFQEQARLWRQSTALEWADSMSTPHCPAIWATAHHGTDQVETILWNILRGAGVEGAMGMDIWEEGLRCLRPLLVLSRGEIEAAARLRGLTWREDASNQSRDYARNHIRLEVLPHLRVLQPRLEDAFARFAQNLRAEREAPEGVCPGSPQDTAVGWPTLTRPSDPLPEPRRLREALLVRAPALGRLLTRAAVENLHHEGRLFLKGFPSPRTVPLPCGWAFIWKQGEAELVAPPPFPKGTSE